ncbi:hypothetical protein C7212DRAFT_343207 [Tuber magnatum]|uniref:Uncharacterized protein n=1 Tax=Tuber magnatum TaxID=42249 RepID=A0A317SW59_9PEZI|nr:hypothetical protein C7212DRAFT_343207 [Tuber magnatum]
MSAGVVEALEPKISRFSRVLHRESCSPPSSPPPSSPLGWHIAMAYRVRDQLEDKSREILDHANPPNLSMHTRRMEGIIEEMESINAALDRGKIPYDGARRSFQLSMEMLFEMSSEFDRHLRRIRSSGPAMPRQKRSLPRTHREMRAHRGGREGGKQPSDRPSLRQRFARGMETLTKADEPPERGSSRGF